MEAKIDQVIEEIKERFVCDECEMVFAYKKTLKRHYQT
jgi:uncharacterized C2H2 Zn-finger protein